jgi:hypothetical protein
VEQAMAANAKRSANKAAIKRRAAAQRKRAKARAKAARPGRVRPTAAEIERVVPRMTRA